MNKDKIVFREVPNAFGASLRGFLYAVYAVDGFGYTVSQIEDKLHLWKLSLGPYSSLTQAIPNMFEVNWTIDDLKCNACGRWYTNVTTKESLSFILYYEDTFDRRGGLYSATVGGRWVVNKEFAELYANSGLDGLLVSHSVEAYYSTVDQRRIQGCRSLAPLGAIKPSTMYLPVGLPWIECSVCGGRAVNLPYEDLSCNTDTLEASGAVLGCTWSGHDFCADSFGENTVYYCTARALDWLLSIHAGPFIYLPVDFLLKDTTHYHRHRIEECKGNAILEYVKID